MEQHLIANAAMVRRVAEEQLDLDLAYDVAAVRWLDGYIDRQRDAASPETKEKLPNTLGAFLGECVRNTYGGRWVRDGETGSWAVELGPKLSVFPFNKVRKQLASADGESVLAFFNAIPALLRR